jgi:formylmethanofuran dehydrogenase subunit E
MDKELIEHIPLKCRIILEIFTMDRDFEEQLEKAVNFHGHICGGIVIGTKMAMYAMKLLDMELNKKDKDLMVFVEIDRCMADAVQSVTGCSLGKKSLKHMEYGKFASTFYNVSTGKGIRITDVDANKDNSIEESTEELIERFKNTKNEELFKVQNVKIRLDSNELGGSHGDRAFCSLCKERVMDNMHILRNGKIFCKSCAEKSYYELID